MSGRLSTGTRVFGAANGIVMVFVIAVTLYPMVHVITSSVSDPSELIKHRGVMVYPLGFSLDAYARVFQNPNILGGYRNTLFYLVAGAAINLTLTTLGAFVLSRRKLYWRNAMMFIVVFTMFFSGGLIPLYLLVRGIRLIDNPFAVILPPAINSWNLIVMRTSFQTVPDSLEESAKIDGANDLVVLWHIIIPLSAPVIAVMALFYGVERWNAWFYAMIFLRTRQLYPLQLILREILIYSNVEDMMSNVSSRDRVPIGETVKYATIMVATLPILFVYPFLQRYFVKGVMIGALKG